MPDEAQAFSDALSGQVQAFQASHKAVADSLETYLSQGATGQRQLAQNYHSSLEALAHYQQTLKNSALELAAELEGPQNEVDGLGAIMLTNFAEQLTGLDGLRQADLHADQSLSSHLTASMERWRQAEQELAGILARLSAAETAATEAVTTNQQRQQDQAARQAIALNQEAVSAYRQGYRQKALALMEQAERLNPADATIALNMAQLALETGRLEQAEQACQAAAERGAPLDETAYVQGLLALQRGAFDQAIQAFETCLGLAATPGDAVTYHLGLAEAYYASGHPAAAVTHWREVLTLEPLHPVAQAWLQAVDCI
jgi:tetratricopeptide (TPR) repeat protein